MNKIIFNGDIVDEDAIVNTVGIITTDEYPSDDEGEATPPQSDPEDPTEDATDAPSSVKPGTSSTGGQKTPTNSSAVKTGSTEAAIAFITLLVMAAGVVLYARKRKFD